MRGRGGKGKWRAVPKGARSHGGGGTPPRVVRPARFPLASLFPPLRWWYNPRNGSPPRAVPWYGPMNWRLLPRAALVRAGHCSPTTWRLWVPQSARPGSRTLQGRFFLCREIVPPFAPSRMAGLGPGEETPFSPFPPVSATPHPPAGPGGETLRCHTRTRAHRASLGMPRPWTRKDPGR